ncbi:MAG: tetratricopeptide repeat protein [Bacteroidales bacterium]|nr:MAG: tetratricopeptide repeat protein [Bacteroidales bacterium]
MGSTKTLVFLLLCVVPVSAFAQAERKYIREGNRYFENKEYDNSEISYRKALGEKDNSFEALFNLGDALYKQAKFGEAATEFNGLSQTGNDALNRARSFHNMGNSLLKANKIEESINAYKNALRNNPADKETKYNLSYAQDLLRQQQQQKEQDKNRESDQDKQDQQSQQNEEEQDREQQQQQSGEEEKQGQEQEPQPQQISKEDAERLLEALANDEKLLQEKLKKAQARKKRVVARKNW